jgi:N utilization substance protein B
MLFQLDFNPPEKLEDLFDSFWQDEKPEEDIRDFAIRLVTGVWEDRIEINKVLAESAEHWDVSRMGVVDRNVMRMAIYELLHCTDIPPVVSINEAVDIAKYFSSSESGRFVNGILDRVRKGLTRPARKSSE